MKGMKISFYCFFIFFIPLLASGQEKEDSSRHAPILNEAHVTIRNVFINGNKITKRFMIIREIVLKINQSYSIGEVTAGLDKSKDNLMNTSLFVNVKLNIKNWQNDSLDIYAEVDERWYYIPSPYFRPMDRNIQVWASDYKFSLKRVNFGVKFMGENTTGRNDKLNIWLMEGFSRKLAINYYNPFSDPKLRFGWAIDFNKTWNKEVFYNSVDNKQVFFRDPTQYLRKDFYLGATLSYRKGSVNRHYFRAGWNSNSIADTLFQLNRKYFENDLKAISYPELQYTFQHLKMNYFPYPTKGSQFVLNFLRRGLNSKMDLSQLSLRYGKFDEFKKKNYYSIVADAYLKVPFKQPYINQYLLGYGDHYLRGLERYVVDGLAGGTLKGTIGRQIASVKVKSGFNARAYKTIPFKFYVKLYGDVGYIYNNTNLAASNLNNKLLYSFGAGFDVVSIYDFVLRIECTYNQFNKLGVYFHNYETRY